MTQPSNPSPHPLDSLADSLSESSVPESKVLEGLLDRARGGDAEAVDRLWRMHQRRLELCVRQRLGRGVRARAVMETIDIVQETFAQAQEKLDRVEIRHRTSILDWLAKIAENKIHDQWDRIQAQKRNPPGGIVALESPRDGSTVIGHDPVGHDTLPDRHAERAELIEAVQEALAGLKQEWQDVIYLREYLELPWEEVAERLGMVSAGAAKQSFLRAKVRLASVLGPSMGSE